MKKITPLIILLSVVTVANSSAAFETKGFQPVQPYGTFSTLSAYTIEKDKPGIMFSLERSIEPNFYRLFINASYGLTEKIELLTSIPFIFEYRNTGGIGDTSIGYKYNIVSEKRLGPSISYLMGFSIPGDETFSTRGRVGGALLVSKRVGPFRGHGNLFYFKSTSSDLEDEVELRLGLDLAAAHSFNILSELIVKKSHFSERIDLVEGKMGYRVKLSSNSYAALGVGYDFKNRTPELRIFLTLSLFPLDQVKVKRVYEEEGS